MAKTKTQNKKQRKTRPRVRRIPRAPAMSHSARYAALLMDPCNADPQLDGAYGGEKGYIQRFVADGTLNTVPSGTATSGFIAFHPNGAGVATSYQADPTNNFTISLSSYLLAPTQSPQYPGVAFLAGTAQKQRAIAACASIVPSALSITNMVGEVSVGVISLESTFGTYNVNDLFTLLGAKAALTKKNYEVKWYPGALDDRFSTWNSSVTVDASDTNVIVVAWRGYPSNTALSCRLTGVVEWTPRVKAGLPPSNQVRTEINHNNVVSALQTAKPHWWHNLGDAATATTDFIWKHGGKQFAGFTTQLVSQKAAQKVLGYVEGAAMEGALLAL